MQLLAECLIFIVILIYFIIKPIISGNKKKHWSRVKGNVIDVVVSNNDSEIYLVKSEFIYEDENYEITEEFHNEDLPRKGAKVTVYINSEFVPDSTIKEPYSPYGIISGVFGCLFLLGKILYDIFVR